MAAPAAPTSPSMALKSSPTAGSIPTMQSLPPPYSPSSPSSSTNRKHLDRGSSLPPRSSSPPVVYHPSDPTPSSSRRPSTVTSASGSSSIPPPSTAPTTPLQSRHWRPTPNVPPHIAERHRGDAEDRNRWLSEDEGTGGIARSIGRRRRRNSGGGGGGGTGGTRRHDTDLSPLRPPSHPKTTTPVGRPKTRESDRHHIRRQGDRSGSASDLREGGSHAAELPQIESIVPPPSDVARVLPPARARLPESDWHLVEHAPIDDDAQGAGGSGIGGVDMGLSSEDMEEVRRKREKRKKVLEKLRRAFRCTLCPSESDRLLHHPLTLPCGHTLSSEHLYIPAPPPLRVPPDLPPHELFDLQQHQHQQRLNLWTGVMCPIPTCKRYSPHVAARVPGDPHPTQIHSPTTSPTSPHIVRPETLPSGVTYYPPPHSSMPPPAYSADAPLTEAGSPLLDVTVDKVMQMVVSQLAIDRAESAADEGFTDEDDTGSIINAHLDLGDDAPGLSRASSVKRRRNTLRPQPRVGSLSFEKELYALLECDVCSMLLYDPVTTPCQHSFCAKCLSRSLDHSQRCPVCRQELPSFSFYQDHSPNKLLLIILNTAFPEEYLERQASIERDERDARLDTPIFVCTLAFPGMPTILHVFEPRYRLMIRRCIESQSPRFGMVLPSRGPNAPHLGGVAEYGTMLEIQSVQMLPDGRSMVETVGTSRFKLLEKGSLDGYTVGRIERIEDISPEEELAREQEAVREAATLREQMPLPAPVPLPAPTTVPDVSNIVEGTNTPLTPAAPIPSLAEQLGLASTLGGSSAIPIPPISLPGAAAAAAPAIGVVHPVPPEELAQTTEEYMIICRAFIEQLKSGSAPWLLQRLNNTYGSMPTDPSEFSYWMALVMPIDEYEKARLLPIRSPRLRLKLIVHWVESLRSSWWFSSGLRRLFEAITR